MYLKRPPLWLALAVLVLQSACATGLPMGGTVLAPHFMQHQGGMTPPPHPDSQQRAEGSGGGFFAEKGDAFQVVQEACGLEGDSRHPVGGALYPHQARRLWKRLAEGPVTLGNFAPRLVLSWLLREALVGGERVEYVEVVRRAERFWRMVVVRPDGYLVTALGGKPLQRLGKVELVDGQWKVGRMVVGAFYLSSFGVFYPLDESLRRSDTTPWGELALERDWLNAALDGAQDALGEMAVALAQSVLHPIRSVEGLLQLPSAVAHLIASSPEYFARYGNLSLQDQIREAARLSTHLMMMYGGATGSAGTMGRIGGVGAEVPVLSLSARGELVLGTGVVGTGTVTTTLGAGVGAVSILHMAVVGSSGGGGPGKWDYKTPTTDSENALDYQEQVTGQPASLVYMIDGVEFDGFTGKELLEAKGPNYIKFFNKDGTPKSWYVNSGKFRKLVEQAKNQWEVAKRVGLPLTWHVADAKVAEFLRSIFKEEKLEKIDVRHTPPAKK